jgi:hypothetical protein
MLYHTPNAIYLREISDEIVSIIDKSANVESHPIYRVYQEALQCRDRAQTAHAARDDLP